MNKRIEQFGRVTDNYLVATYFQFGRYLLISSSQPDNMNPANLQGIWNDKMFPSWDSKYTTNINLEMNYWPSEVTNLTEMNEPLFKLIREIYEQGKETAREMYGAEGWVLHHNTDQWRITGPVDRAQTGLWPVGAAWLCRHLWEHYLYTQATRTSCVNIILSCSMPPAFLRRPSRSIPPRVGSSFVLENRQSMVARDVLRHWMLV